MSKRILFSLLVLISGIAADTAQARTMRVSYYGGGEKLSKYMANGQPFNTNDPTIAAHKYLPFGTHIRLFNPQTHQSLVVTVQDRGPVKRDLDVSKSAAAILGFIPQGVAQLEAEVLN